MAINLDLEINEVNTILASLAKQPYEAVAAVIGKVRDQGIPQVAAIEAQEKKLAEETTAAQLLLEETV
jgi:hypothetical protein